MLTCGYLRCLWPLLFRLFSQHGCEASEFSLPGDYKIGGFISVHMGANPDTRNHPIAMKCSSHRFLMQGYQMLQVMRFAVAEINNSSTLLPNVTLGYELFDLCFEFESYPSALNLSSENMIINVDFKKNRHSIIGVVGPLASSECLVLAPLFMMDLIPMISYGSSSFTFSNKLVYPSFMRTVPTNKDLIQLMIRIVQYYGWNWVAFVGCFGEYSENGVNLFRSYIQATSICLAYLVQLQSDSNYEDVLHKIELLKINVILVFTLEDYARTLIKTAIKLNIRGKVWIACETWSMDVPLSSLPEIGQIGTILGITDKTLTIPGFRDFISTTRWNGEGECSDCQESSFEEACSQTCVNCTHLGTDAIVNENPTYSFPLYSAVYSMANALHKTLNCSDAGCSKKDVQPYMLLPNLRSSSFYLLGRHIEYDQNGDSPIHYNIFYWAPGKHKFFQIFGTYETRPNALFVINDHLAPWGQNDTVPFSNCSVECNIGCKRIRSSTHQCCFQCDNCPANTYINVSVDRYTCVACQEGEWSEERSTYCRKRTIVYLQHNEPLSVLFLLCAATFFVLSIAVAILFVFNYHTPVVKSSGGVMSFLMLLCLILSNIGVFFYFGVPQHMNCVLRNIFFIFFFTICLSCMAVRSFQIVCIFKMAAKFPKLYNWWVKYSGQWLCLIVYSTLHLIACSIWLYFGRPKPYNDYASFTDQTILSCDLGGVVMSILAWSFLWFLSVVCFCFSYMGKDLPKNYSEAKSITFSLVLFYLGWIAYYTAYIVFRGKYVQLFNAVVQLSSSYGIIFSFFIPRSFIIVFQPHKNTQAYFQSSIQTYTQTISRQ